MKSRSLVALTVALLLSLAARADVYTVTFAEVNAPQDGSGYPQPEVIIGTQGWVIPSGQTIVSATLSGVWGETSIFYGSTAYAELYFDGILVSDASTLTPDPWYNVTPWSYSFSNFSSLTDGSGTLSYIMTSDFYVRLSQTTLTINTRENSVPDTGATALLLGGGLAGLLALRRRATRA